MYYVTLLCWSLNARNLKLWIWEVQRGIGFIGKWELVRTFKKNISSFLACLLYFGFYQMQGWSGETEGYFCSWRREMFVDPDQFSPISTGSGLPHETFMYDIGSGYQTSVNFVVPNLGIRIPVPGRRHKSTGIISNNPPPRIEILVFYKKYADRAFFLFSNSYTIESSNDRLSSIFKWEYVWI